MANRRTARWTLAFFVLFSVTATAEQPLFNMPEIRDANTLKAEVLQDWHPVTGAEPTRQKLMSIRVGELWPGQDWRVPVRLIVPHGRKAKGFHLTGGHQVRQLQGDIRPRGVEADLVRGGVGLVYTIVQDPRQLGQAELGKAMYNRFIKTLNPHYSIQYWGWPATLMRAITAAYAETDHFERGKVACSGGSKNGASPSVALIADKRITALHASVSPIWDSPLRLCDRAAWDALNAFNRRDGQQGKHFFLGGTFGPIYNHDALAAGHRWEDLQALASRLADDIFISRNLEALKARQVDLWFHPGTHDFVAFDVPWGGAHHKEIPLYLRGNSGHGKQTPHPAAEKDEQNKAAFLLQHFFDGVGPMLDPPRVAYTKRGNRLQVTVQFLSEAKAQNGRIWWMYDRPPDGSVAYLRELFPDDQWQDMQYDDKRNLWAVEIALQPGKAHIDFFSNHKKALTFGDRTVATYISSPYTRIALGPE